MSPPRPAGPATRLGPRPGPLTVLLTPASRPGVPVQVGSPSSQRVGSTCPGIPPRERSGASIPYAGRSAVSSAAPRRPQAPHCTCSGTHTAVKPEKSRSSELELKLAYSLSAPSRLFGNFSLRAAFLLAGGSKLVPDSQIQPASHIQSAGGVAPRQDNPSRRGGLLITNLGIALDTRSTVQARSRLFPVPSI